jgi:hypothetical protein
MYATNMFLEKSESAKIDAIAMYFFQKFLFLPRLNVRFSLIRISIFLLILSDTFYRVRFGIVYALTLIVYILEAIDHSFKGLS